MLKESMSTQRRHDKLGLGYQNVQTVTELYAADIFVFGGSFCVILLFFPVTRRAVCHTETNVSALCLQARTSLQLSNF